MNREYTGPMAAPAYPEDKRYVAVDEAAQSIKDAIFSMRQQQEELQYNLDRAERILAGTYNDLLTPKAGSAVGSTRVG